MAGAFSTEERRGENPVVAYTPLCRCCHKPMRLETVEPHARYGNLDECEFRCECGTVYNAVIARALR